MLWPMNAETRRPAPAAPATARAPATSPGGPPAPVTLITGAEPFLISRAVARVIRAARAVDPELERREVDALDAGAQGELLTALSPSLFGGSAVVVISNLVDAGEPVLATLRAGLLDLPADTWVVALHAGVRNRKVLDGLRALAVPGGVAEISCAEVKRGRPTREFLEAQARQSGRRITPDGVDALVMALGSDIALLVGALEQLMADNQDDPIDAADVSATFAGVAEVSGFQLADAVWEGHAVHALQRLRWGMNSQTLSGVGAVAALASGLRAMVKAAGTPRGMAEAEVARLAGVPPFKVRALRAAASSWEHAQLADSVTHLADVDAQVKGGLRPGESLEQAQKARALEAFVIDTVGWSDHRHPHPGGRSQA